MASRTNAASLLSCSFRFPRFSSVPFLRCRTLPPHRGEVSREGRRGRLRCAVRVGFIINSNLLLILEKLSESAEPDASIWLRPCHHIFSSLLSCTYETLRRSVLLGIGSILQRLIFLSIAQLHKLYLNHLSQI
jgi:hypothetical protein